MMAERGRMLRLENLPPDITADKLKIILSNKRRQGGGPVDNIDLNSKEHSAIVTFSDCEAVNIILNRGNFLEIQEFEAKIFCVDDISKSLQRRSETVLKNKKTPSVAMSFTEKSSGKNLNKQESYNGECGSSNRKNTSQKLQSRNYKKETHSLSESESSESSDDIYPSNTRNTNNIRVLGDQDGDKPLNRQKYEFKSDESRKKSLMRKGHSEEESKKFEIDERTTESSSDIESSESSEDNSITKTKGSEKMSFTDNYEDKSLKKQKTHSIENQAPGRPNIYKKPHSKEGSKNIAADKKKLQSSSSSDSESSESSVNKFEMKPKNKGRNSLTDEEDIISSNRGNGHGSKGASSIKGSSKEESRCFVSDKKPLQSFSESECFSETSVSSHDDDSDDEDLSLAEKAEKTVKIKIIDAKKPKDFYQLYLEDDTINEGEFYEKSILLDGLNKHVFVTFKNAKDARAFCRTRHDEDSNITKAVIASENDFNWYSNLVAVFGYSFESTKDKKAFKELIFNCLKCDVQEIIQYDEPRSLIVKFNPKHCHQEKVGDLLWKCAVEFCGIHLITAPVEKSNQILISGLSKGTDNNTVERYLSSKRHGGSRGQLSSPIKRINDHQAIATLKSVETIESILNKNIHELEGKKLTIDYFHYCLSPEVYEKHFGLDKTTKKLPKKTRAQNKPKDVKKPEDREIDEVMDAQQKGDKVQKKKKSQEEEQSSKTLTMNKKEFQKGEAERMTLKEGEKKIDIGKERKKHRKENKDTMTQISMPLKEHEKEILQIINFFADLKIETEFQPELLNLRGTDENIMVAKSSIFNKCYKDFKKLQFSDKIMDTAHLKLLQISGVQRYINKMFKKKHHPAFLEGNDKSLVLHYLKEADEAKLIEVVKKQIESKKLSLGDQFSIFQSFKGSEFIAQLCEDDKDKTSIITELDQSNKSIHIVVLRKYLYQAQATIERFMEENQIHEHEVPMLRGEIEYIERFMSDTFKRTISELMEHGISVHYNEDKIVFQGTEDGTRDAEIYLSDLRDKIKTQTFQLKNFGIKEFLSDKEGKKLIDEFENLNTCVIKEDDNSSISSINKAKTHAITSSATKDIACCQLKGREIIFTCGNILEEIADGIISPLHVSKKLGGGLGKAILAKGGDKIQEEVNKPPMITEVKITSAGKLNNIQKIVHFIAGSLHGNLDSLKDTLQRCLLEAVKSKIQSLAIPFMVISGMLKIGKTGFFTALLQTIETFLDEEDTDHCIQKIILCDKESSNVKDIIERSEAIWKVEAQNLSTTDDVGYQNSKKTQYSQELSKSQPRSPAYGKRMDAPKFGPIRVDVRKGVITKSKTDVIVFTVNENLDLKIGHIAKNILRYGGDSIQEELNNNYSSGIQVGDFAETKAGNLKCRHIVHACLSRYNGKRAEMSSLVFKILTKVNEHKFESISIPALGTGGLKYPARESALGIQEGITNFVKNHKKISLKKIMLIIYDKDTAAEKEFKSVFCPGENDDDVQDNGMAEAGMASGEDYNEHESDDNRVTFGTVTLTVKCGDITQERCDAIVNGIKGTMDLTSSGSVCKSILRKCGKTFQEECTSKIEDISEDGVALTTSAGKLPCKNIIHINMDKFSRSLDKGIYKALQLAEQNEYTSLSIPALGTAKKGADLSKIKKMIYSAIEKFGNTAYNLSDIRLVVYHLEMVPAFLDASSKDLQDKQARSVPISDHVDLIIFTEEKEKLQLLIQKFKRDCDLYFTKESVAMPKLGNFTKEQIKKLQNEGLSHRILLTIDAAKGCVYYEGLKSNTKEVLQCIYNLHIDLTNNKMLNLSKNTGIQWEYKSKEKWKKFEPLINAELETEHKRHQNLVITDSKGRCYRVDFMKNLEYWLDAKGKVTDRTSQIRRCDLTKEEPLPTHWDSMESDENVKLVELSTKSKEYKEILKKLQTANVNFASRKIERVQNKTLYQQYSVKKREMDSRNPPGHENEKLLYHGTAFANTDPINHSGFNRNYKTVAAYGDGVYFAVDPKYSVSYAKVDPATNLHKMYLARVLVGESVVTKQGDRSPPNKPGKNYPYDSGTDGNGVMYIIFHDAQAYPDYLITF